MKKSIVVTILVIYIASIIVVGFFGMSVKVYDAVKYVQSITMTAEASDENMFSFNDTSTGEGKHAYTLNVYFPAAQHGPVENKDGDIVEKDFIAITLIPKITYKTGDLGAEESVVYTLSEQGDGYVEKGYFTLSKYGVLTIFGIDAESPTLEKPFVTTIYINPEHSGDPDAGAVITLKCLNKQKS